VTLDSITARGSFSKLISKKLKNKSKRMMPMTRKKLTNLYLRGEISNFDYLLQLNLLAGRSYRDLSQYPVFPWIAASYLGEKKQSVQLRDLSKPMGALREERRKLVVSRYESLAHEGGLGGYVSAFHYGTHYSCMAYVANYLVRLYPYVRSLYIVVQTDQSTYPINPHTIDTQTSYENCKEEDSRKAQTDCFGVWMMRIIQLQVVA